MQETPYLNMNLEILHKSFAEWPAFVELSEQARGMGKDKFRDWKSSVGTILKANLAGWVEESTNLESIVTQIRERRVFLLS